MDNSNKSGNNTGVVIVVVIALLAVPCLLGLVGVGGLLLWEQAAPNQPAPVEQIEKLPTNVGSEIPIESSDSPKD